MFLRSMAGDSIGAIASGILATAILAGISWVVLQVRPEWESTGLTRWVGLGPFLGVLLFVRLRSRKRQRFGIIDILLTVLLGLLSAAIAFGFLLRMAGGQFGR